MAWQGNPAQYFTREIVEDGVSGILIQPKQPEQIAQAVIQLLGTPERAREIGINGAERARAMFSLDHCAEEHMRLYTSVLEGVSQDIRESEVIQSNVCSRH